MLATSVLAGTIMPAVLAVRGVGVKVSATNPFYVIAKRGCSLEPKSRNLVIHAHHVVNHQDHDCDKEMGLLAENQRGSDRVRALTLVLERGNSVLLVLPLWLDEWTSFDAPLPVSLVSHRIQKRKSSPVDITGALSNS